MATSMLGATVMPHAIYLHSTLVNDHYAPVQPKPSVKTLLHGSKIDVFWALLLAGSVNLALLILAANSLHGMTGTDTIEGAQQSIEQVLGPVIGTIFSIGLLASSLSSTSVGTYAGAGIDCTVVCEESDGSADHRAGDTVDRYSVRDHSADEIYSRSLINGRLCGWSGEIRDQYGGCFADCCA